MSGLRNGMRRGVHRTIAYERPWLYPEQAAFLFTSKRYSIVEASTKTGKTVGCLIWLNEQAVLDGKPGWNGWWVAPVYPQASIAYRRLKRYLRESVEAGLVTFNDGQLTVTYWNGAVIWFKSAEKPDNLYGEDVFAAVIDEATRCREESWYAVRSTLTATRGPLRVIGNVKGRRNWAYQLARQAEQGDPEMFYARLTAWHAVRAGILDAQEILDAKRLLPPHVFDELYLAIPGDDTGNPFGFANIRACVIPVRSTLPTAAIGIDLAKAQDYTVILGLDQYGRETFMERWTKVPWQVQDRQITALLARYDAHVPVMVDSTGVGDPLVERWQSIRENVHPFVFTGTSKQQAMEGLALALAQREVGFTDGVIRRELDSFEYMLRPGGRVLYSAPDGQHDDCVIALALARQALKLRGSIPTRSGTLVTL